MQKETTFFLRGSKSNFSGLLFSTRDPQKFDHSFRAAFMDVKKKKKRHRTIRIIRDL